MRVALDTTYAQHGVSGTAVYIERLIPALEDEGVEVVELRQPARRRGGRNKLRSAGNVVLDLVWTRELLPRAAARAEADVIHHPLPAWSPTQIPQVVTVHDVAFARRPEDFDPLWRRIALRSHRAAVERAAAVIAVSETTARDASAWLRAPAERVVVAQHGPGQELPVVERRSAEHFLYVGDAEPRKNVDGLLTAHAEYRRRGGSAPLVLAGVAQAAMPECLAGAAQAATAADDPIRRIHAPDARALADLHAHSIALVHASRDEGFGLTVLEAMAAGTPVIAVRNAAIEELVGDAGILVDEHDLAAAMEQLDGDPELQRQLSDAGRARAAAFSWQRSARAHIAAYTLARDSQ